MHTCQFCKEIYCANDAIDKSKEGFWCDYCDGFTYFNNDSIKHRFTLILEDKEGQKPVFSPPPMKLRKHLSPMRYPGGKSRTIDYLYTHLQRGKTKTLVSPFTGGGSFELSMLDAGVIERLHLNDLDTGVFSLWYTILHAPHELIDRLRMIKPNKRDFFRAQTLINADFQGVDAIEAAWSTLLVNRLAYSGIVKANPLGGRKGTRKAMLARWNPEELIKRIEHIYSFADLITITQEDAVELIEEAYWYDETTIFIDPPYVTKGKALYNCFYTKGDHLVLSGLLDSLHQGMPGADLVVTYDFNEWLQGIYQFPNEVVIGRNYSI